jgi:hypothetical protein
MDTKHSRQSPSKLAFWSGWVLTILPSAMLVMSAVMKFVQPKEVVEGFQKLGVPLNVATGLGVVELACVVLYLIPQSSVLGAILCTGYLGGAIATHVLAGDPFFPAQFGPLLFGVVIWIALYLREPRLRSLAPLRSLS